MEELFTKFIANIHETRQTSSNTEVSYLRDLRQMQSFLAQAGIKEASKVTPNVLSDYVEKLNSIGKKPSTVSRSIASMKAFFGYLADEGIISENPTLKLKTPKIEKKDPHILSAEDTVRLIESANGKSPKGLRDRAMLELMYATGVRVSELISLKTGDINLQMEFLSARTGKKERVIPFGEAARDAVLKYLSDGREALLDGKSSDYLFVNCSGDEMSRQGFWKLIKSYGKKAGIKEEITPHTLRHSFAAHLVSGGAEVKAIQEMLGHSDISTTQVYLKMNRNNVRDAYKKAHPRG